MTIAETSDYDDQIAVTETAPDRYSANLDGGWVVGGGVNGGYLLSTVGNALRSRLAAVEGRPRPDPLAISAYYLSASVPGPAEVRTEVKRVGGSIATAAAELWQGDDVRISALATYGDLSTLSPDVETTAEEPFLPPVEECVSNRADASREVPPLFHRFDLRFHPDHVGWALGQPNGRAELSAWFRLWGGREPDPISLLLVVDALPPTTLALGRYGWAPTLELTAHVRALPAPGWLKVRQVSRNLAGGMFEEDCEVWDSTGRLVAQSRQLARQPRPSGRLL